MMGVVTQMSDLLYGGVGRSWAPVDRLLVPQKLSLTSDESVLHVVAAAFSAYVGERRDRQATDLYQLARGLGECGLRAGTLTQLPPSGRQRSILRELGLTRAELGRRWLERRAADHRLAVLDLDLLTRLFPQPIWEAAAAMVMAGPAKACELVEGLLFEVAARPAPRTARRPEGGQVSASTVYGYALPLQSFMRRLCELRRRGFPCRALDQWVACPRLDIPRVPAANTDTSAPSVLAIRRLLQRLTREIQERLGADSYETELDAVRMMSGRALQHSACWQLSRDRALLWVLCMIGPRVSAACRLRRPAFREQWLNPDGELRPALAMKPDKDPLEPQAMKQIPDKFALITKTLVTLTDRMVTEAPRYRTANLRPQPDWPLFPGCLAKPHKPIAGQSFSHRLAGCAGARSRGGKGATKPLLPRPGGGLGYSAQRLRSAALIATREGARDYAEEHDLKGLDSEAISEALLDHADMRSDRYGYAQLNTPAGRERLSAIATKVNFETFVGDRGARRKRDPAAYERELRRLKALQGELANWRKTHEEARHAAREHKRIPQSLLVDLLDTNPRDTLEREIANAERRIEQLKHDPATTIIVADDAPDDALLDHFDEIERRVLGRQPDTDPGQPPDPVRDWVTVQEFRDIAEVAPATAPRWARGEHLPYKPGDPRRPWEPDAIPIDHSQGPRRRRIAVEHVNPGFWRTERMRQRLTGTLTHMPSGWSNTHCNAPLELPTAFNSLRRDAPLTSRKR